MLAPQPRRILFVFQVAEELTLWEQGNRNQSATGLLCPNRGAAAARNFGARHADSRYLVFLDDDCVPVKPHWLVDLVAPVETLGALLSTGAVLGWDAVSGSKSWMTQAFRLAPPFLTPWGNPASVVSSWCDTVAGGNFALERSVFFVKGAFSEEFGSPSLFEETELSLRIAAGKRKAIWFSHEAAVTHHQEAEGGMRDETGTPSEKFLLDQKNLLLRLVYGEGISLTVRFELYRSLRRVRRLLRAMSCSSVRGGRVGG
jgi:glycosyltransferase involved in cell wall biosynthesis